MRSRGSASITVLMFLLALSLLASGVAFVAVTSSDYFRRSKRRSELKGDLVRKAEEVVELLVDRSIDPVDSPLNLLFTEIEVLGGEQFTISLKDVGSYLGLNWIRKPVLKATGLLLDRESSAEELQQFREDTGLHMNIGGAYGRFFQEGAAIANNFTAYSYFNINLADEFVLRKLYALRTGDDPGAEAFHSKIHAYRLETEDKKLLEPDDLPAFLDTVYERLFPLINALPVINVNFAPESVLLTVLKVCDVADPGDKVISVVASRQSRALNREAVQFIMGDDYEETQVRQYLGSRTWFWRLEIRSGRSILSWVLARIPSGVDREQPGLLQMDAYRDSFRLIEESYSL